MQITAFGILSAKDVSNNISGLNFAIKLYIYICISRCLYIYIYMYIYIYIFNCFILRLGLWHHELLLGLCLQNILVQDAPR